MSTEFYFIRKRFSLLARNLEQYNLMMDDRQYHLKFDERNAASVDAYLEYKRIVGDDDGGTPFTQEQYDQYKKKVLPMRLKNRLFTSWSSPTGMDCKMIGPETPCFCQHRYKQHKTDFETIPSERPILLPCKVSGCRCVSYHYIPLNGSQPLRCHCKHFATEHSEKPPYQCTKDSCQRCAAFKSSYSCACGESLAGHQMIVETKSEREARGHPVGHDGVPYQAMGGITGFSSLADGYMRLDPSGRGAPSEEWLSQEITSADSPFLKGNVPSIQAHRKKNKDYGRLDEDMAERMSAMRVEGESELDYYERRYQDRLKAEKKAKQLDTGAATRTGNRMIAGPKSGRGARK